MITLDPPPHDHKQIEQAKIEAERAFEDCSDTAGQEVSCVPFFFHRKNRYLFLEIFLFSCYSLLITE